MKDSPTTEQKLIEEISSLKQKIRELEQSEEEARRLASIVRHSRDLINLAKPDGRMVFINDAGRKMLGISGEDIDHINIMDLIPGHLKDKVLQEVLTEIRAKGAWEGNLQYINMKTGDLTDVHTIAFSITDPETGKTQLLANVSQDITDRVRSEQALRESEEKYRDIFENAIEGIFQSTPDGHILDINPAFARIFGYNSPQDMMSDIADIEKQLYVDPLERVKFTELLEKNGVVEDFEVQEYRKDGTRVWILLNARTIRGPDGTVLYYEGTANDITEHKKIREELRMSDAMYRTIFDNSGTSMIIIDENTTIVLCNSEWVKLSGYSREENEGKKSWTEFVHEEDLIAMRRYHSNRRVDPGDAPRQYEFRFIDRFGNIHNMINTVAMIPGTKLSVAAQIDITSQKQAETDKIKLQSQLLQSQKMEAIGTLAGGIAHDFNNILTAITGYSSLLQMDMDDDDQRKHYVDQILASSQKAANLTQSLLAFSRKQTIELKPCPVNNVIEGVTKLLKRLLTEDIDLRVTLADKDIFVMCDVGQIDQVLINLATNARDAMPGGGLLALTAREVMLDDEFVRAHGFGKPGGYALISISDTGCGMDERTREKIFEPFFTTKDVGKGTGLGLSIVYGIIRQHDGFIYVYSEPGKGTTFNVYIPLTGIRAEEPARRPAEVRGGTETILVAEDNNESRGFLKETLTRKGYRVIEAIDGEDALWRFGENKDAVDLLILDVVMPRKNGKEVYEEIRRTKPDVRVLFASGYTGDVVFDKGVEREAFDFIEKPVSPNDLLLKIREILDR